MFTSSNIRCGFLAVPLTSQVRVLMHTSLPPWCGPCGSIRKYLRPCRPEIEAGVPRRRAEWGEVEMCGNYLREPIPSRFHDFVPVPIHGLEKS